MASANTIRMALIKLLRESDNNRALIRNTGESEPVSMDAVRSARQEASDIQGIDPLAAKPNQGPVQQPYQVQQFIDDDYGQVGVVGKRQKGFTPEDAMTRATGSEVTSSGVTSHHMDPYYGPNYTKKTVLDDIEGANKLAGNPKLIERFEKVTGRKPTRQEANDERLLIRIIESIEGPRKSALDDDIPF